MSVKPHGGFTLIELTVVVAMVAILSTLLIPRLPDLGEARLKSSARRIAQTITYLYDRAAGQQTVFRLTFDLDENRFVLFFLNPDNEFEPATLPLVRTAPLPEEIRVADLLTATQGKVSEGKGHIHFFPGGYVEQSVIHLADEAENALTLIVSPVTGRVEILEGYVDVANG